MPPISLAITLVGVAVIVVALACADPAGRQGQGRRSTSTRSTRRASWCSPRRAASSGALCWASALGITLFLITRSVVPPATRSGRRSPRRSAPACCSPGASSPSGVHAVPRRHRHREGRARPCMRVRRPRSSVRRCLGSPEVRRRSRSWGRSSAWSIFVGAGLVVFFLFDQQWALWAAIAIGIASIIGIALEPRRVRSIQYRLREDDLLFRRGIMFQRQVAVPYGRMQLVDITRGPVARALGLADLKFVTAAASTAVTVPGLPDGGGRPPARRARRARRDAQGGVVSAPRPPGTGHEPRRRRVASAAPGEPAAARRTRLHRGARHHHREPARARHRPLPRDLRTRRRALRRPKRRFADDWANDPVGAIVTNGLVGWALIGLLVVVIAVDRRVLVVMAHAHLPRHATRRSRCAAASCSARTAARGSTASRASTSTGRSSRGCSAPRSSRSRVAGQAANVQLSYLGSALADALRADVLRLASGARAEKAATQAAAAGAVSGATSVHPSPTQPADPAQQSQQSHPAEQADPAQPGRPAAAGVPLTARAGGLVTHRVDEFLAPELDPTLAPPESVVHLPLGRVIGSTVLGGSTIWTIVLVGIIVAGVTSGQPWVLFSFVPAAIGLVSYMWSRITKSLRYSIAGTPDGVRIGHGLLSTGNQTIPPGRVHAIEATQWVFWRPFGWWSVRINVAGHSSSASNEAAQRTIVLPVGTARRRAPGARAAAARCRRRGRGVRRPGLTGRGDGDGYSTHAAGEQPGSTRSRGAASAGRRRPASHSSVGARSCAASPSCRSPACSRSRCRSARSIVRSTSRASGCTPSPAR